MISPEHYAKALPALTLADLFREDLRLTKQREQYEHLPATFAGVLRLIDSQLKAVEAEIKTRYHNGVTLEIDS